jgi:ATPase subunit of ABC transporter with duplicated ATPase domains
LIEGLDMFKGTLIFVSHDRHFVDSLANRVLDLLPGEGGTGEERKACKIEDFGGTYVEYLERTERNKQ